MSFLVDARILEESAMIDLRDRIMTSFKDKRSRRFSQVSFSRGGEGEEGGGLCTEFWRVEKKYINEEKAAVSVDNPSSHCAYSSFATNCSSIKRSYVNPLPSVIVEKKSSFNEKEDLDIAIFELALYEFLDKISRDEGNSNVKDEEESKKILFIMISEMKASNEV